MNNKELRFVTISFLVWRISLFIFLYLGRLFLPLQKNFLGGGLTNYLSNPSFWAWANFDGEHYLSIAQSGYGFGEQAFFPFYPFLIKFFGQNLHSYMTAGLFISNISFFLALLGLFKLVRIDFSEKITKLVIILLLVFPTSLYFGSVYTESLFLCLAVWSFYYFRKENYIVAGALGAFASATRVIGILLLPIFLIDLLFVQKKVKPKIRYLFLLLILLGLGTFMFYLWKIKGDPLAFIHSLPTFGEQRSSTPILLPQVFYRYLFKILPNINYRYFPIVFTTMMEFLVGIAFLIFSVISLYSSIQEHPTIYCGDELNADVSSSFGGNPAFSKWGGCHKIRLSYAFYLFLGYLIPTLTGSFSSLPRYVLVLFPAFVLMSIWVSKLDKSLRIIIVLLWLLLGVSTALFTRGYWLS